MRTRSAIRLAAVAALLLLFGCSGPQKAERSATAVPNRQLLDEINRAHAWFHARKSAPIWARRLTQGQTVTTLEGVVTARAGDFLCRGEAGDLWPQAAAKVESRYVATGMVDNEGWRKYEPRRDVEGVLAAQVHHAFQVETSHGTLKGKAGDYVLKNFRDRGVSHPADVWIVDQQLFRATYQAVTP